MKREQLNVLIQSLFADMLEEKYYHHNKKVQEMLECGAFVDLNSKPHAREINKYVAELMAKLARGAYEKMKQKILEDSAKELDVILGQLLDESESEQVLEFVSSPVGRKLARNLDILREVFSKHITDLNVETFKLWNEPEVAEQIDRYVKSVTGEDE